MGQCCSFVKTPEENEIDHHMLQHNSTTKGIHKLLLLGTGSSGKSTLFKQFKVLFDPYGLEQHDFQDTMYAIRSNLVASTVKLLLKSEDLYREDGERFADCYIDLDLEQNQDFFAHIQNVHKFSQAKIKFQELDDHDEKSDTLELLGESIDFIWKQPAIQCTFIHRGTRFSFMDNMDTFFAKSKDVFRSDFFPSKEDVLKCKVMTTGVVCKNYLIRDNDFQIYDVGGQRNERKKWIHIFDDVTAVIFVAALSHFDAVCFEDENKNAMHESIETFAWICNSQYFQKTAMILFLNKEDLFRHKILNFTNTDHCFSPAKSGWQGTPYDGPCYTKQHKQRLSHNVTEDQQYFEHCYETQIAFIREAYMSQKEDPQKRVYVHCTNATNKDQIQRVFWDCQNIVIRQQLHSGGLTFE